MKKSLEGRLALVLLIGVIVIIVTGCGNFREQALEAQSRLDEAVQLAEIAEDAAARNAGLIIDLERRIEALEASLEELQVSRPSN